VVTVTTTLPVPGGEVAVIVTALMTFTFVAPVPPNETVAGDAKLIPVMVTTLPPLVRPDEGDRPLTVGGDK
jgi:hypothetical protein